MGPEQSVSRIEADPSGQVRVFGSLTIETVPALWEGGRRHFAAVQDVVLDLGGVSRCDSAGVAMLVDWVAVHRSSGGSFTVRALPEQMRAILQVSDLNELVTGDLGLP